MFHRSKNVVKRVLLSQSRSYEVCPPYPGPQKPASEMYKLYPLSPRREVPEHIVRPNYVSSSQNGLPGIRNHKVEIKTPEMIEEMSLACSLASYIREFAGKHVRVGITTDEIDELVHNEIIRCGAYPSPLGYYGFPKSVCTSVNNVICHGIPDMRPLEDGDIINIDVTVYINGYHGDCSATFLVGNVDEATQKLVKTTKLALDSALAICKPGVELKAIGAAVQEIAEEYQYGVVPGFTGHGIGKDMHMAPNIFHYKNHYPGTMVPGMVFTIEPMLNASFYGTYVEHEDNWTILTVDGAASAQFEETIVITEDGYRILTTHNNEQFAPK